MKIDLKSLVPSRFTIAIVTAVIATLLLLGMLYSESKRADDNETLAKALADTVTIYKTKEGKNAATIRVIQTTSRKQAIEIAKTRNANIALQLQRNRDIVSITEFTTLTRIDTVVKMEQILLPNDSNVVFKREIKNEHYHAQVAMRGDSLALGIEVYNKHTITHQEKSNGLFKEDTYIVDVVNDNPYTQNTGLASYEIKPKKKNKFLKGVIVGAAAVVGGIILLK